MCATGAITLSACFLFPDAAPLKKWRLPWPIHGFLQIAVLRGLRLVSVPAFPRNTHIQEVGGEDSSLERRLRHESWWERFFLLL